eukprot:TRINITY_DN17_c0_g1_i2.p1 TRINITY_DN17_c0_g1~~TRINITY_DN17_c0_g1_i2.p1  ORF type:complete len:398 (+),score=69.38 TRINITY_DN17_c0_g1_i2:302-1495(+)
MKGLYLLAFALFFIAACDAHTRVSNVTINGRTTAECLRPGSSSNPIMSSDGDRNGIMQGNYTCGFLPQAARAATASCSIAAGSSMNISYYHGANYGSETPDKDYWIASSHRGPFLAYMARWENSSGLPDGLAWFKIFHSGITKNATGGNYSTTRWASPDTLNSNDGAMTVRIPSQLAPGRYLLRTEIIALHDSQERGAQPYVRCIDLTVTGNGKVVPKDLVAFPGAIGYNDPGLRFSVYQARNQNYPIPGPAVFDFSSTATVPSGNGTVSDISCAGFPGGACPTSSVCNNSTGRCQCVSGFRETGFQCVSTRSTTKDSTSSSTTTSSTTKDSTATSRSTNASGTKGSTSATSQSTNKGSTNATNAGTDSTSEIEEVASSASSFAIISAMLIAISFVL